LCPLTGHKSAQVAGALRLEHVSDALDARRQLVAEMREYGSLRVASVAAAFAAVPRELFLPDRPLATVYADDAIVTKRDADGLPVSSSSQPSMMAQMLELLELAPGQRVLEVGAGTGYNAALIAHIVGASGRVTTIDVAPDVAASAAAALARAGAPVEVVVGDGRAGWEPRAPYDRIIVTAAASAVTEAWWAQLREGGRLVVPLITGDGSSQQIPVLRRRGRRLDVVGMTRGGFMPLHGGSSR
jgi:protein-L-isoaspartate(D-aspartate) O-methyltransferase